MGNGEGSDTNGPWDLVVIGGGTAGIVGAKTAAGLGARVLLIEGHKTGGDCLYTGCVPSKALLAAGGAAASARRAGRLGITVGDVGVDFAAVMDHVRASITTIEPVDSPEALDRAGVTVVHGNARVRPDGIVRWTGGQWRPAGCFWPPEHPPGSPCFPASARWPS